jgi:hypothetical protein
MPVQIDINGELEKIQPTNDWKALTVTTANPIVTVDSNYYVAAMNSTK